MQNAIEQKPKLRETIVGPIIDRTVLPIILSDFGLALSSDTLRLLVVVAERGYSLKIDGIINAFKQLMAEHRKSSLVCIFFFK